MSRNVLKSVLFMAILVGLLTATAWADSAKYDPCTGANLASDYKAITKIKPLSPTAQTLKVKPYSGLTSGFGAVSHFNPMNWWQQCCLPSPTQKQFVMGGKVFFARLHGEMRKGTRGPGTADSLVDFDDHLGLSRPGSPIWTISAHYQFQPRWGIRYSITPMKFDATHETRTGFTFGGQSFTGGSLVNTKWQRFEHRAGLVFDLSRTTSSVTSAYAEWLYVQDKISIGDARGTTTAGLDDDKSMALMGLEINKCLKNYRGNTLALSAKGGIAFMSDSIGYDAEAALNYMIPVKRGRFGFLKGGYRYTYLKKERAPELFKTSMDGAFLEVGFLF